MTLSVSVVEMFVPDTCARIVTGPAAEGDTVTTVLARPWVLDVLVDGLKLTAPIGVADQTTLVLAMPFAPVASVTFTVTGALCCPALMLWLLPLEIWSRPGTPGLTVN